MRTGKVSVTLRASDGKPAKSIEIKPDFSKSELLKLVYSMFPYERDLKGGSVAPHSMGALTNSVPLSGAAASVPLALKPYLVPFYSVKAVGNGSRNGSASKSTPVNMWVPIGAYFNANDINRGVTASAGSKNYVYADSRTGVKNPNWKSQIRAGGNATTGMQATRYELGFLPGSMAVRFQNPSPAIHKYEQQVAWAGNVIMPEIPLKFGLGMLSSSVDNGALGKLFDKLYALEHDADIGETLGEYRQLIQMFGKPLNGIREMFLVYERLVDELARNTLRRVGRGGRIDPQLVRDFNAALARLWLEVKFGIYPLIMDIQGLIKAAQDKRNNVQKKVSASWRDDSLVSTDTFSGPINSYCWFTSTTVKTVRYSVRYQVGVDATKVDVLNYVERIGITPSRFVPTLYAIMPYSWLLDYFTGIDNVLNALCADFTFTTWACKTARQESIVVVTSVPDLQRAQTTLGGDYKGGSGAPAVCRLVRYDTVRSIPTTLIPAPSLSVPKSWKPWANIAALVVGRKLTGSTPLGQLISAVQKSAGNSF